ncbi:hypothetical protein [Streptomyces sp. ST1020]|uniref:hypothetical protein n=1 Tax=Streptomyces sp. ST1020 TaxID=1848901 RepID=UPI0034C614D6
MQLQTEVPLIAITPGNVVLNFYARFYQTQASSAIGSGKAKGDELHHDCSTAPWTADLAVHDLLGVQRRSQ